MATHSEWEQRQLDIESGKELDRIPKRRPHDNPNVEAYLKQCRKAHLSPLQSVIDAIQGLPPKAVSEHHQEQPPCYEDVLDGINQQRREINLLSGRVEIQMRLIGRIIAKMDPAFIEDPFDPEVRRRSDLLTDEVIKKMKADALAQAMQEPDCGESYQKLKRYFKDMES